MGVDTKGVVLTQSKNVMLILGLIERSLNRLINCERRFSLNTSYAAKDQFSTCSSRVIPSTAMAQTAFTFKGSARALSVFFDCDSDHVELAKNSVSMSIGCEGHSDVFVKTVLHALSVLGPVHYDYSDSDDIALSPLDEYTPTVLQMVRLHYLTPSSFEHWVTLFDAGQTFPKVPFRKVFGATREWVDGVLGNEDFKERWAAINEAAGRQELPELKFMSEYHSAAAVA